MDGMAHKTYTTGIMVLAATLLVSCTNGGSLPGADSGGSDQTQTITLYFYSEEDLETASGVPSVTVTRTVNAADATPDHALRLLFQGPTQEEQSRGARSFENLSDLRSSYLGITMDDGTAIIDFERNALPWLNGAAAMQGMIKTPMEETLMQFPGVTDVQYAIDGEIFTEWDA